MPAKDSFHDAVVNALKKDGWETIEEQFTLLIEKRLLWIDVQARSLLDDDIIVVEIKGFDDIASPVAYFEHAIGQYLIYQVALEYKKLAYPLYLAVPHTAYFGFLREKIAQLILQKYNVKLLVYDPLLEEIVLWQS